MYTVFTEKLVFFLSGDLIEQSGRILARVWGPPQIQNFPPRRLESFVGGSKQIVLGACSFVGEIRVLGLRRRRRAGFAVQRRFVVLIRTLVPGATIQGREPCKYKAAFFYIAVVIRWFGLGSAAIGDPRRVTDSETRGAGAGAVPQRLL